MPCIKIPTRKIFEAMNVVATYDAERITTESTISHVAMPRGMRAIITIGEVKGIIDDQKAIGELGSLKTDIIMIMARMIGIIIMELNCWLSWIESTAEPAAAYNDA